MATHDPSNFATYRDDAGAQLFNTWFTLADWGNGKALYAYQSWDEREDALDVAARAEIECEAVKHRDAFLMIRAGTPAWLHEMTVEGIRAFRPLFIQFPALVA